MVLSEELLKNLQNRLKVGNRRGVHLNAIPSNSRYKFDLNKLSSINKDLPNQFISSLLSEPSLKFKISWKSIEDDIESLFLEDQAQLVKIKTSLENLINQTSAIEAEKGVNTFGFGFPLIARKDASDNKLTVAPLIIWSLRIRRSREYNTWEIIRTEDDPIYMNEVFINHVYADSAVILEPLPDFFVEEGYLDHDNLANVITNTLNLLNPGSKQLSFIETVNSMRSVGSIKDKAAFEKLTAQTSISFLEMAGLFSIFEVQKQSIIQDYEELIVSDQKEIETTDLSNHHFQSLSTVDTDPSQQGILNSLKFKRNTLIQGPPGTGKSQTLTAVLLNALENGKKVLVVCEKRTALEVLFDALKDLKLDHLSILLRDVEKDRRVVVEQVKEILAEIENQNSRISRIQLDEVIKKADRSIEEVNRGHKLLSQEVLHPYQWSSVVAKYLKAERESESNIEIDLKGKSYEFSYEEFVSLRDKLVRGEQIIKDFQAIQSISRLNSNKLKNRNIFEIEEAFRNDLKAFQKEFNHVNELYNSTKKEYLSKLTLRLEDDINELSNVSKELNDVRVELKALDAKYRSIYIGSRLDHWQAKCDEVQKVIAKIYSLEEASLGDSAFFDENQIRSVGFSLRSIFSRTKKQVKLHHFEAINLFNKLSKFLSENTELPNVNFRGSLKDKYSALDHLSKLLNSNRDLIQDKFHDDFTKLAIGRTYRRSELNDLHEAHRLSSSGVMNVFDKIISDINGLELTGKAAITKIVKISGFWKEIDLNSSEINVLSIDELLILNENLLIGLSSLKEELSTTIELQVESKINQSEMFVSIGVDSYAIYIAALHKLCSTIKESNWLNLEIDGNDAALLHKQLTSYIDSMNEHLDDERDIIKRVTECYKFMWSLDDLEINLVKGLWVSSNWLRDFSKDYYNKILKKYSNEQLLSDDKLLKELNVALKELKGHQVKFVREFWKSKQAKRVDEFHRVNQGIKVSNLYNFRKSKNYERFSLRKIVKSDKDLFTSFFPVILTSPEVASTLFKGDNGYFDLVVFDEASQLRLEDNLPALMKGKQVVIAGDEHQMPPSNYFSKIFEGIIVDQEDEEEDETENFKLNLNGALIDCESLLHFGENLGFNKRYLDFHYRSKHPFLIDFSNSAFYQNRLKPLPQKYDYSPIQFIQVNGTFSDHCNDAEAEMVLEIIDRSIIQKSNGTYPSVGVATFNISQRDLIEEKINERLKNPKFDEFNRKMESLRANGFFIKNLENIQGDERDIIILSTTYGKGADGKFHQRFGPLAQAKGHRLLNVIITRAKYKVFCCTSIPDDYIMSYKSALVTEGNRKKAVFYAYLAYCKAVSSGDTQSRLAVLGALEANNKVSSNSIHREDFHFDSEFEVEVYDRLVDEVGEQHLIPQMKVGGFRIDLVYKSPIEGVPMIAIECDGAKYHSSQEAYLYDLHRQKILEDQGFVFHRIWSTNWWRSPKMEMKRLVQFIKDVEAKGSLRGNVKSMIDHVYIHSVEFSTTDLIEKLDNTPFEVNEVVVKALKQKPTQVSLFDGDVVTQESKVKVLYRNTDDLVEFKLVKSEKEESNKGKLRLIYYKKPLAQAIIGKRVGDVVKIGKLDTYVEILEITN